MKPIIYWSFKESLFKKAGRLLAYSLLLLGLFCFLRCKKLVEAEAPYTSINALNAYEKDATATAVLTGIYIDLSSSSFTGGGFFGTGGSLTSLSLFPGLSADELTLFSLTNTIYLNYYKNTLTSSNTGTTDFWTILYKVVFVANTAIEGLNKSTSLTPAVKQQLLGEAKFIRAFCYFYLVNLYGDVPLALTSDPEVNRSLGRISQEKVYEQIVSDLTDAQDLLNSNYVKGDIITSSLTERIRPNKWAAKALLARTYLYRSNFANAETQATAVINNTGLYDTVALSSVFLKDSKEAIWQLQPVLNNPSNTQDARLFVLPSSGPNSAYPVYLSNSIVNSFEMGDQRKTQWVDSVMPTTTTFYFPNKYKNTGTVTTDVSEYLMVMRLAEQYLIRAEARAQQNNFSGSRDDLNVVRKRARLPVTTVDGKAALLAAILRERKTELFTEWGNRWFDLKRTATIDAEMTTIASQKGTTWNRNWQLYPIPITDIQRSPILSEQQNPGYQ